jgi:hypothetical protein
MKYRVVFRERGRSGRATAENPVAFLQGNRAEDIVRRAVFVFRRDPEPTAPAEPLIHDEEFAALGTQTWEYEVAEGKDQEFKDALLNSGSLVEFTAIGAGGRV